MIPAIVTLVIGLAIVIVSFFLSDGKKEDETEGALADSREKLEKQLDAQYVAQTQTQGQLEREKRQREKAVREVENIRGSLSYRIGRAVTWLPRKLRALLRRKNGRE